jgi:phosphatidylserine/phosphatidylglycerophosphate/cardiolipin synthase-like enzyme
MKTIRQIWFPLIALFLISSTVVYAKITPVETTKGAGSQLEWAFTKADEHPEKLLIGVIDSAKRTLDIAIYSLTHPEIVDAIKKAQKRGVAVRLITDQSQSNGKPQQAALEILGSANVPIKVNRHSGLMHLKTVVADQKVAVIGSFNFSKAAATKNDEVLMVIRSDEVAKSFAKQFESMWIDTKNFETADFKIAQE